MVRTISVGGQEAAAVRGNHFQSGKAIKRALEDEVRERDGCLQRVAYRVAEPAIPREPLVEFGHALRMNEQGHAEFLGLGPDWMEFRVGEFDAVYHAADCCPLQSLLLHRGLKFLHREIGSLQGKRGEGCEPFGL